MILDQHYIELLSTVRPRTDATVKLATHWINKLGNRSLDELDCSELALFALSNVAMWSPSEPHSNTFLEQSIIVHRLLFHRQRTNGDQIHRVCFYFYLYGLLLCGYFEKLYYEAMTGYQDAYLCKAAVRFLDNMSFVIDGLISFEEYEQYHQQAQQLDESCLLSWAQEKTERQGDG